MHQLLNIPSSAFFTLSSYTSTRGHNLKLLKPFSRCHSHQLFYSVFKGLSMIGTVYQPTLSMLPLCGIILRTYWINIGPTNYLIFRMYRHIAFILQIIIDAPPKPHSPKLGKPYKDKRCGNPSNTLTCTRYSYALVCYAPDAYNSQIVDYAHIM